MNFLILKTILIVAFSLITAFFLNFTRYISLATNKKHSSKIFIGIDMMLIMLGILVINGSIYSAEIALVTMAVIIVSIGYFFSVGLINYINNLKK